MVTDIVKTMLDSNFILPVFYAVDLTRLPPVEWSILTSVLCCQKLMPCVMSNEAVTKLKDDIRHMQAVANRRVSEGSINMPLDIFTTDTTAVKQAADILPMDIRGTLPGQLQT